MDWLNTYAAAITGLAGAITAAATVAIAALTYSTMALYRLERGRERSSRGMIAAHLWRLQNHFKTLADMLDEVAGRDPMMTGLGKETASFILDENARHRIAMAEVLEMAKSSTMRAVASLDAALLLLPGTDELARRIARNTGGHASLVSVRETLTAELRDISSVLRAGYESLPATDRGWGNESASYDQVLARVLEPIRDAQRIRNA